MKTLDKIPTGKIERASQLLKTGIKIGGNYVAYYGEKIVNPELNRDKLNENNAEDIYDGLKNLKGSALKVAQMLSMDKSIMPQAYVDKFSLSQFSVPPLSAPLVKKTFKKYLGKYPEELYDTFTPDAVNAASIGQVHKATKDGKTLAVKIQYPGVADSISSDLALVKPIATRMFNLRGKDSEKYFKEVEYKLLEETDYVLELKQSQDVSEWCKKIENLRFPEYFPEFSSEKILTMEWIEGEHLSEFTAHNSNRELGDKLGQALWDFYMYQMHYLKQVHADPHPGNFIIDKNEKLVAIDFGCIKHVPEEFYVPYFELADPKVINNPKLFTDKLYELEILRNDDSPKEIEYFTKMFHDLLSLFTLPFHGNYFDFSDEEFFGKIAQMGEEFSKDTQLRKMNGNRGSKHFLYINRTFFGLYNLLHDLKARVDTKTFEKYID
ncbi:MAG TPA: AarF/ABC1/UbiB kinase family protein [Flavobacterium sp.]|jgi:predicted unusual protein kinase regulating ubiquinone biosynthesis (AarF/ABC1/UbiB family)|uniref:ABC1 kinase family protein n=1 Tax=Flavobacterium sp. TaxID=239 RepID=UPI002CA8FD0C|nr:AarF/ABC1/UbiB kinase family protein [Flavobacterium sp.]MCA0348217.1 AarF/ABC1/UbiB kinase family protein [Bacteroidota bacterium]HPW97293.1 AarF/ABC1/UbiB kinase family protein [Flavobacterium sp.]HQA74474.1 AarF/ABC1/UbiB kinase family protein [Flavobacterium sp.]